MQSYIGNIRLYFNSHQDAPKVWCILAGDREFTVSSIVIAGVYMETKYDARWKGSEFHPSAWLECDGRLQILEDGTALIVSA